MDYEWCTRHVSFDPQPGAQYELRFRFGSRSPDPATCVVDLSRIVTTPAGGHERVRDDSLRLDTAPCT